jgi:hypothetical protein
LAPRDRLARPALPPHLLACPVRSLRQPPAGRRARCEDHLPDPRRGNLGRLHLHDLGQRGRDTLGVVELELLLSNARKVHVDARRELRVGAALAVHI